MGSMESTGQRKGPAPAYSKEAIARAAITIADEQGIEAVTMRKVAASLGTGAMSLYRYVDSKDDLYDLMVEGLLGQMLAGRQDGPQHDFIGDWRADLRMVAHGNRAVQLAHPWFPKLTAIRPAMGPNMLAVVEAGMSILDGLGLDIDDMMEICGLVINWVTGFVQDELGRLELQRRTGLSEMELQVSMGPQVEEIMASGRHPYFTRIVHDARHRSADERFERALDRLIAGIEATLPD